MYGNRYIWDQYPIDLEWLVFGTRLVLFVDILEQTQRLKYVSS